MNKNLALMALTGILTLASCGQGGDSAVTCATGQVVVDGKCVTPNPGTVNATVKFDNVQGGNVTIYNSSSVVVENGKLGAGTYTAKLEKAGYQTGTQTFTVDANGVVSPSTVRFNDLVANAVVLGNVKFENTQDGKVTIFDANSQPVTGTSLPAGQYTAKLEKAGYQPTSQTFTVDVNGVVSPNPVKFTDLVAIAQTTTGRLVIVNKPVDMTVTIKDKDGKEVALNGSTTVDLAPGDYTYFWTQNGASSNTYSVTVLKGETAQITAPASIGGSTIRQTAYFVKNGVSTPVPATAKASDFRFNAWLEDTNKNDLKGSVEADDLDERAPSGSQNLVAAYMEYNDGGTWYPVQGAEVRMDLLPSLFVNSQNPRDAILRSDNSVNANYQYAPNTNATGEYAPEILREIGRRGQSIRFTASDDGSLDSGSMQALAINAGSMSTVSWTNGTATATPSEFPSSSQKYPLYNQTGIDKPSTPGFTWATVMDDPDLTNLPTYVNGSANALTDRRTRMAQARIRAIGYVNGVEIDKVFMTKNFVAAGRLAIKKEIVNNDVIKVNGSVSYKITITNAGQANVSDIKMSDVFSDFEIKGGFYSIRGLKVYKYNTAAVRADVTNQVAVKFDGRDGFKVDDNGQISLQPGEYVTFEFDAQATEPGMNYCDVASVTSYTDDNIFDVVERHGGPIDSNLKAEKCFTVQSEPALSVVKTVNKTEVGKNEDATFTIKVKNNGNVKISNVVLNDVYEGPTNSAYYSLSAPAGAALADKNWSVNVGDLAPQQEKTFTFTAQGSQFGQYCDTAKVSGTVLDAATSANVALNANSEKACFTVGGLIFSKVNQVVRNGKLVAVEDLAKGDIIKPGELYLTTITLENRKGVDLHDVRLWDRVGYDDKNAKPWVQYEDRLAEMKSILGTSVGDAFFAPYDRVDAYDARTDTTGKLTAGRYLEDATKVALGAPLALVDNVLAGKAYNLANTAQYPDVRTIVSDDANVNTNRTNIGGVAGAGYTLPKDGKLTLTFFNRLPQGATAADVVKAGKYCNKAWYTYTGGFASYTDALNGASVIDKCVQVTPRISFKLGLNDFKGSTDTDDFARGEVIKYVYDGALEISSTQGSKNNVFTIKYGVDSANLVNFTKNEGGTMVEIGTLAVSPDGNTTTWTSEGTVPFTETFVNGVRTVTLDPNFVIEPGKNIRIITNVSAPDNVAFGLYSTTVDWQNLGELDNQPNLPPAPATDSTTIK